MTPTPTTSPQLPAVAATRRAAAPAAGDPDRRPAGLVAGIIPVFGALIAGGVLPSRPASHQERAEPALILTEATAA